MYRFTSNPPSRQVPPRPVLIPGTMEESPEFAPGSIRAMIEMHIARTGIAPSTLSRQITGDSRLVAAIRGGRQPSRAMADRIAAVCGGEQPRASAGHVHLHAAPPRVVSTRTMLAAGAASVTRLSPAPTHRVTRDKAALSRVTRPSVTHDIGYEGQGQIYSEAGASGAIGLRRTAKAMEATHD